MRTRPYLHAVIDNFSRRILSWHLCERFCAGNSVAVLVEAGRRAGLSSTPTLLADGGVENVNDRVDELIGSGLLRRVLAQTEIRYSNSMIEAWWRSLMHNWLFLHSLDSVARVAATRPSRSLGRHRTYTDLRLFDLKGTVERLPLPGGARSTAARSA